MKVIDRWTTQYGSWDVKSENKYGIDQAHRDKYLSGRDIPPAGADHHIMVLAPDLSDIRFRTAEGQGLLFVSNRSIENGWVNFPMSKDAGYNSNDRKGPWQVWVEDEMVADGIGLPDGEHVSTFLVVGEGEPVTETPPTPTLTVQQALAQVRHDLDILESLLGGSNG